MTKTKVIQYSTVWLPQTKTWLYNQVANLPSDTIESHIVCEKIECSSQFDLPNIHCLIEESKLRYYWDLGLREIRIRYYLGYLTYVARNTNAQILHSHFGDIGWRNLNAVKQLGIKHVVTFYGLDVNQLPTEDARWKIRYKQLFSTADLILCEGPHMANCLVALGCNRNKIKIQHLGIAIDKVAYRPRQWEKTKPLKILIAASFREKKGIPYALEALARISKKIDISITVIGEASTDKASKNEKKKIMSTIQKYDMASYTNFLGFRTYEELFSQAYEHHLFVSPSVVASDGDTEGGAPISIIDMIATGMPVVSTKHCDIPNVIQYGIDDWLVNERDVSALTDKILYLVNNPDKWKSMLDTGRSYLEKEFNSRIQGEKLAKIYQDLILSPEKEEISNYGNFTENQSHS